MNDGRGPASHLIVAWGVLGVSGLLLHGLARLAPIAWEPIDDGTLTPSQWVVYVAWVLINAHAEGYRGFHRMFSPRVIVRARHLARHPRSLHVLGAPLYCMSLFHASRRGRTVAWAVLLGVVCLVVIIRGMSQPWRGIIDGGVVVGLGLGLLSLLYFYVRFLIGRVHEVDPDLP